jgi:hypothetical protein
MLIVSSFPVFNVDATIGDVAGAVTDSYEWQATQGYRGDAIRLNNSEYYLIATQGPDSDGWLYTLHVWNNNGTIQKAIIDSYEFLSTDADYVYLVHIPGTDKYAIYYRDVSATKGKVSTVKVYSNGTISKSIIDTTSSSTDAQEVGEKGIVNVNGNIYAIIHCTGIAFPCFGYLETLWINSSGTINDTVLNTMTVDVDSALYPSVYVIDSNTVACTYANGSNNGQIATYNISSAGVITLGQKWNYEAVASGHFYNSLIHISGNVYAMAWRGDSSKGQLITFTIATTGVLGKTIIDSLDYDAVSSRYSVFTEINATNDIYALSWQGTAGEDGYIGTVNISDAGSIGATLYDSLEFDTGDCKWYPRTIHVADDYYLIVYPGPDTGGGALYDGWAVTVDIESYYYPPAPPTYNEPGISFLPDTTVNGTSTTVNFINANISSDNGNSSTSHYTYLDINNETLVWMPMDYLNGANPDDISPHNNSGTINGGASQSATGKFGKSFYFDGDMDYITIPTSSSMDSLDATATVSFWAKSTDDYSSFPQNNRGLVGFKGGTLDRVYMCIHKTGYVSVYRNYNDVDYGYKMVSGLLPAGFIQNWHQYTFIFTSANVKCYIDGAYTGMANFTLTWNNLDYVADGFETFIGKCANIDYGLWEWKGYIDEVIINNRAFSTNEIAPLYNASATQYHHNFTSMVNGNYTFTGYALNNLGLWNKTETRWFNITMQYQPTMTLVDPTNGSTDIDLWKTVSIIPDDLNADPLTVYWSENTSGSWVVMQTDSSVLSGNTVTWTYTNVSDLLTTYWFRVSVSDGTFNTTGIFHFTTGDQYFILNGMPSGIVDWGGIAGSSYWCNDTGTYNETMEINMSITASYDISDVGVWVGPLSVVYAKILTTGWNVVSLEQWVLDCFESVDPQVVFDSIYGYITNITEVSTGKWWNITVLGNLTEILANTNYNVYVTSGCQLFISSQNKLDASNIGMQLSSDNATWGANTRTYADNGSTIVTNHSSWSIANGCYGANPFPIGTGTTSIYARFELNIPLSLLVNYTYFSLSSTNWKVFIYSNMTSSNVTLPPLKPASLPPVGQNFSLKWTSTNWVDSLYQPTAWDTNGDGIMEIAIAGGNDLTGTSLRTALVNGSNGNTIWAVNSPYIPEDTLMRPTLIVDVDHDGNYEVVVANGSSTICYNSVDGSIKWDSAGKSGYHPMQYIDTGSAVYIYTAFDDEYGPVYDGRLYKIRGTDGVVMASVFTYHPCYGALSVGDLDNDGTPEIIAVERGQGQYPGTPATGVRCFDMDLNQIWQDSYPSGSSHNALLVDLDYDGDLEVVVGNQRGAGISGLYCYEPDGTRIPGKYGSNLGLTVHLDMSVGDPDSDGHMELMTGDGNHGQTYPQLFDLTTFSVDYTFPRKLVPINYVGENPAPIMGNVIDDPAETPDYKLEIIQFETGHFYVYKWNPATSVYDEKVDMPYTGFTGMVADVDHDGYNEILIQNWATIRCFETRAIAYTPRPPTQTSLGGGRSNNNFLSYEEPFESTPVYSMLEFGGSALLPPMNSTAFILSETSQHPIIELNGYYNKGYYTTYLNSTIYLPTGWTIDSAYLQIKNNAGVLYENITTGITQTTISPTLKRLTKNYNPTASISGMINCTVNVFLSVSAGGIPVFSGNRSFANVFRIYDIGTPTNGIAVYNTTLQSLNMTWSSGAYNDRYVVVRKNGTSHPTTPTDGTVVQNATKRTYNESSVFTSRAYSIFGYNTTSHSYSMPLNNPWGALGINCFNESKPSQAIPFDLEITNQAGTIVYKRTGLTNTHFIDVYDIPYGTNTIFILESSGYKQRIYYKDISLNTFSNYSFYLPRSTTQGGGGTNGSDTTGCTLRLITNSINVSSYTANVIVPLTHEVEDMVAVEIYNRSLYISYGGWIMIPETKFTVSTTQVTIDKSVLDKNTSMARVSYYYMYCPGDVITTPLYYIRVVETVETEYSTYDRGVEGVKVDIKRYVNTTGIYVSVAQLLTDANGYCNVYLIPGTLYKVLVSKLLYNDALSDYIPAPANQFGQTTEKIFRISLNETTVAPGDVDYLFKNIVWSIEPTGIRHPGAFTMWFNITSSDSKLEWYSMEIFYWNTTTYSWVSIFYQNDSNAGGGSISFTIPNVTGKYAVKCYFKKTGFPVQELGETGSLIHFIQYFQQWMHGIPDYAYYIVLLFIMVVAMGFFFMYFGTGISTGYIGIIIFAIGLFIHPVTINGISGWIIFAITFIMYTIGIFLWSRI